MAFNREKRAKGNHMHRVLVYLNSRFLFIDVDLAMDDRQHAQSPI